MAHEIYEHDNMFSVGETPWHKLGVVLDNPPTIEEAIKTANLDWEVRLLPLYAQVEEGHSLKVSNKAVFRNDTREILGIVGSSYTPLQNKDAFTIFEPLIDDKSLLLETAGSLKNGRRVWILGRINSDGAEIAKGDEVRPYVLLSNSHDGMTAVRFGFTPIRVVCNNTLSAAEDNNFSKLIRLWHTSNLQSNLDGLRNILDLAKGSFISSVEQYRYLASREINQGDLEKYVKIVFVPNFEVGEATEMILTRTEKKVIELFETGRGANLPKAHTWWGAYNALNEFLMYERGRTVDNRLESVWFADSYVMNRRGLDTALRLAA